MLRSLSSRTLLAFLVVATTPILIGTAYRSLTQGGADLARVQKTLDAESRVLGDYVEDYVKSRASAIDLLAVGVEASVNDRQRQQEQLDETRKRVRGLRTLLIADVQGKIRVGSPGVREGARDVRGDVVADRDYFKLALAGDSVVVTGVFQGRGFGADPIVAVARAFHGAGGNVVGVVEGSVNLNQFARFSAALGAERAVVVTDADHRVIYASAALGLEPLSRLSLAGLPGGLPPEARPQSRAFRGKLLVQSRPTSLGWTVSIVGSEAEILAHQKAEFNTLLAGAAVAWGIGMLLALVLSRSVTGSLSPVMAWLKGFDPSHATVVPRAPKNAPTEVAALVQSVEVLAQRLHQTVGDLQTSVAERDALTHEMSRLLSELDRKVADRTLELEAALQRAQAASVTKTRFLANMSHELRTPLNSVIGFAGVLKKNRGQALRPMELDMVDRILANGRQLLALINDILDISRVEAGRMPLDLAEVDVVGLCRDVLKQLEPQVGTKPLHLQYVGPSHAATAMTDAGKLRQVLNNLVGNAIKFTERGQISLEVELGADGLVRALHVTDTGRGIAPDRVDAIFAPFEQEEASTARRFGGTGLGLAISRALCEMLHMSLSVESALGKGSRFSIRFDAPLARVGGGIVEGVGARTSSGLRPTSPTGE